MENKIHSAKYGRQKNFLLILPLLTLPFLTLMFWAFGGGKGSNAIAQSNVQRGLNFKLPDAQLKDEKALNKLSFYQRAALDSAKTKEAEKLDPYWKKGPDDSGFMNAYNSDANTRQLDANQMKVYDKLNALKNALSESQKATGINAKASANPYSLKSYSSSSDVERLQSMMQKMNEDKTDDPEITQLNDMLDKIQAIQNPDKTDYTANRPVAKNLRVTTKNIKADVSLLKSNDATTKRYDTMIQSAQHNSFYGLSDVKATSDSITDNSIECLVPETQTLVAGATVKMAISNNVTINDINLPSGTLVYGTASISNERLKISINSIRYENSILPVSLSVYDMDGLEGIFIPGSISRTAAKESTNKAISGIDATMVGPSIGAQAASAGIEAAKTLIGKKVKLIKVTVKSGYKVLLKDSDEK